MALRFGNASFLASLRNSSSMKSKEVSLSVLVDVPPLRQLSPPQLQLTSLASSLSRQLPEADAMRGAKKRSRQRGAEVVVGVAIGAVDHDEGAGDLRIPGAQRIGGVYAAAPRT